MYAAAMDDLPAAGLAQYELSNYAPSRFRVSAQRRPTGRRGRSRRSGRGRRGIWTASGARTTAASSPWIKRLAAGDSPVAESEELPPEGPRPRGDLRRPAADGGDRPKRVPRDDRVRSRRPRRRDDPVACRGGIDGRRRARHPADAGGTVPRGRGDTRSSCERAIACGGRETASGGAGRNLPGRRDNPFRPAAACRGASGARSSTPHAQYPVAVSRRRGAQPAGGPADRAAGAGSGEPRGAATSRRWRGSPSSSPGTASTSRETIPSTSTGGSSTRGTSCSSSSTRWRRTSSAISCSTSPRRCATATARAQKLAYAARTATTLGYAVVKQNDKVSLATVDDGVRGFVPPGHSMAQVQRMIEHLDATAPDRVTKLPEALTELAGRTGRRAIVLVFLRPAVRRRRAGASAAAASVPQPRRRAVPGAASGRARCSG